MAEGSQVRSERVEYNSREVVSEWSTPAASPRSPGEEAECVRVAVVAAGKNVSAVPKFAVRDP